MSTGDRPGGVLRLVAGQFGRLEFVKDYDEDFGRDQVISDGDERLLLIDDELARALDGVSIDYQPDGRGGGLRLLRDEG